MQELNNYLLSDKSTLLDAIDKINNLSEAMTVFIVSDGERLLGSLTDGDIRRSLLKHQSLQVCVTEAMNSDCKYLEENKIDVALVRDLKSKGITVLPIVDSEMIVKHVINLKRNKSYLPIDAVLMAGGKGERLRPLTLTTPKPLLLVDNKPIIDYNIDNLASNGIEHIHVTTNYLAEQLEEHFLEPLSNGVKVSCVKEPQFLGTIGSVKFITQWHNDTVLVMNSDLFTNIDLEDFYLHFKKHDADLSVAAVPYSVNIPYGIFEIEDDRYISGVKEKPSFHYYANAGIYLMKREVLEMIPDGEFYNATDLLELLVSQKRTVIRFPLAGYWIDIGKPDDFKKVQEFAKHIRKG